jgi:hypothetical protein
MPTIIGSIISAIGSGVAAFFGFKGEQAKTVQDAIGLLKSINDVDAQSAAASAQVLSAIMSQGSVLERLWRPLLMVMCMVILGAYFFGYQPPNINAPLSPMMEEIFTLLKIGVGGYIPARTVEKIVKDLSIASVLRKLVEKKIA